MLDASSLAILQRTSAPSGDGAMSRWGQHAANLPANTLNILSQGVTGFAQMGVPQQYQQQVASVPQFYPDEQRPAPEGFWQKTADVVGGQLAPNLAALMVPGMGATKLARGLGASERVALSVGDVAAGALQAGAHDDPLAVPEFAAFGALRPLGLAARLAGGATLSAGAQAVRGQNPFTMEGAARMGADALFSGIDRLPVERGPVRAPEVGTSGPGIPVGDPYTRETLRLGYPSPEVPVPIRGETLALPEPSVSIAEYGAPMVDRFQQPALPYRADITVAPNGAAFTREQINDPRSLAEMFRRRDVVDVPPSEFVEAPPTPAAIDRSTSETLTRPSVEAESNTTVTQPVAPIEPQPRTEAPETSTAAQIDPLEAKQQAEADIVEPTVEAPKPPSAFTANIAAKMKAKQETGAVDISILDDIAQYGRDLVKAGADFAKFSAHMVQQFGRGVSEFLEEAWNKIRQSFSMDEFKAGKDSLDPATKARAGIAEADAFHGEQYAVPKEGSVSRQWYDTFYGKQSIAGGKVGKVIDSFKQVTPDVREIMTRIQGFTRDQGNILRESFSNLGDYADLLTPEMRGLGMKYVQGKIPPAQFLDSPDIPAQYKKALGAMRVQTEHLQRSLLKGEASPIRRALIERTFEDYTTNTYDIFLDPKNWKKDQQAFDEVVKELIEADVRFFDKGGDVGTIKESSQFAADPAVAADWLNRYLYDMRTKDAQAFGGSGSQVSIDNKLYMRRMLDPEVKAERIKRLNADITNAREIDDLQSVAELSKELDALKNTPTLSKAWRKLLGQTEDPLMAKARTIAKLIPSAANSEALKAFEDLKIGNFKGAMTASEYSAAKQMDPNNELRFYKDPTGSPSAGVLKDKFIHPEIMRGIESISSMNNSLTKAIENSVIGVINNQVKQNFTVRNPGTSARNYLTVPLFLVAARNFDPRDWASALAEMRAKKGQYYEMANKNGVLGADQVSQEFFRNIEESLGFTKGPTLLKPIKKADEFMRRVYQQPDQFVRFVTFRNAMKRGMSESQAIQFTDRYTHNYGTVPAGVKTLRQLPFFNPFISYNYEMFRVMKNLAQDVGNSKLSPKERMVSAGILTGLLSAPIAAQKAFESAMPEDQQAEWDRMKRASPLWSKGQFRVPLGKNEKGAFNFINVDPFSISGDYSKLIRNLYNRDMEQIIADNPIVGVRNTPLLNALAEVVSGEELISRKPVEPTITGLAKAAIRNTAPPLAGGYATNEMQKSFTRNREGGLGVTDERTGREYNPARFLPTLVGIKVGQQRLSNVLQGVKFERRDEKAAATRSLNEVLKSNRTDEAKEKARLEFINKRRKADEKFLEKTR